MGMGETRPVVARSARVATATAVPAMGQSAAPSGWESRLYTGLRIACVASETRAAQARAMGEAGVEAEYFLALVASFPGTHPSRAIGDAFLYRLEAAAQRLCRVATSLEVATQGYLTALESGYPDIRLAATDSEVWWPESTYADTAEPLELRLRRCGFAYRHTVAVHLASNLEAISEQLALILHALRTLPPAGILPATALYAGLYELTSGFQGYLVPNHITSHDERSPGLLAGIARLRALDASEETTLDSDIAWARAQQSFVERLQAGMPAGTIPTAVVRSTHQGPAWAAEAMHEWHQTISALERLRQTGPEKV